MDKPRPSPSGSIPTSMPRPTPRSPPARTKPNSASLVAARAAAYARAANLPGIEIVGVDMHIGSQITELAPFRAAFAGVADLIAELARRRPQHPPRRFRRRAGRSLRADESPPPDPDAYGEVIAAATRGLDVQLILEPGRLIAANAGMLVSRVIYVKARRESKTLPGARCRDERSDPPRASTTPIMTSCRCASPQARRTPHRGAMTSSGRSAKRPTVSHAIRDLPAAPKTMI